MRIKNCFLIGAIVWLQFSCSSADVNQSRNDVVSEFLNLLISERAVKLSDYRYFYGDSSEQELEFEILQCEKMGYSSHSKNCVQFTNDRWKNSNDRDSIFLNWIKNRFETSNKEYVIESIEVSGNDIKFEKINVKIGGHRFELFHNIAEGSPTGLRVGISSIDGFDISSLKPDQL